MCQDCADRCLSTEGLKKLFSGATMASSRGALVTVGQVGRFCWAAVPGEGRGRPWHSKEGAVSLTHFVFAAFLL